MALVIDLDVITPDDTAVVGGKAANLAVLRTLPGVTVPDGFCVTTEAFGHDDDLAAAVEIACRRFPTSTAFAVRSSATAEDQPGTSFAGQHDSYLDVVGLDAVLRAVRQCRASLETQRAVAYRRRQGITGRVQMAVVVQQLVRADAAGMLFTADPVTGDRRTTTVEAVRGLGDALVSGLVDGEVYRVRDGDVTGPDVDAILTDEQLHELVGIGRRIEAHVGRPQDVEWCLTADGFAIVQSRPITTLFPVPDEADDAYRVYLSVGHQQMMTDAMTPLGLSFWQMSTSAVMAEAGGRLFVDVTARLADPASRDALLTLMGRSDPLVADAVRAVVDRGPVVAPPDDHRPSAAAPADPPGPIATDPAVVAELIAQSEASVAAAARTLAPLTGLPLLDALRADVWELQRLLFDPRSHQVFMSAMTSSWWLTDRLAEWLPARDAAAIVDTLTLSVPHNVTSQMGLALLDVADAVRPHAEVVAFLREADDGFLDELPSLPGGRESRDAIEGWLARYGMRCPGEIDITRPRWQERPSTMLPMLLGNVDGARPGAAAQRFADGLQRARDSERDVLTALRDLPDGAAKASAAKERIDRVRTFIGYREYPKFGKISRYAIYKQALLREAERLVGDGVLAAVDDAFFLRFAELREVVRTGRADRDLIARRRAQFTEDTALRPPRVLTSDGEMLTGSYRRGPVPAGTLPGLAVSAGTVIGRARVVTDLARADLEPGDVLVTRFTDPSWTPLFLAAAALVTEVGGVMTHGAVIAREYGLPAVVGVDRATELITDGARIRVDGSTGVVELL